MVDSQHPEKKEKSLYLSNHLTDFDDLYVIWGVSVQRCAFWVLRWNCSPFWGLNFPKKTILAAWINVFKPNTQNIQTLILSNYFSNFNHILHSGKDHQGWTQNVPHKSRMTDGRHLEKNEKSLYFSHRLSDCDALYVMWCISTQEYALGSRWYCCPLRGLNSPKANFG